MAAYPIIIVFILYGLFPTSIHAMHTINCGDEDTSFCSDSSIICPANDDCEIFCNTPNICNHKTIQCPITNNKQCNIHCIGLQSCYNTTFDASQSNYGKLSLQLQTSSDKTVSVWSYGTLLCPPNGDCNIIGDDTMDYNNIFAWNSISLNITNIQSKSESDNDNDHYVLTNTNIHCPEMNQIYCDLNIHNGLLTNTNIYSIQHKYLWLLCNGDFTDNCYNSNNPPSLYCGDRYYAQCMLLPQQQSLQDCLCDGTDINQLPTRSIDISSISDPVTTTSSLIHNTQNLISNQPIYRTDDSLTCLVHCLYYILCMQMSDLSEISMYNRCGCDIINYYCDIFCDVMLFWILCSIEIKKIRSTRYFE